MRHKRNGGGGGVSGVDAVEEGKWCGKLEPRHVTDSGAIAQEAG